MPKPYPSEFRDDVVRIAQSSEPGVTIEQIAKDFGVHPMTLQKWLHRAKVEDGSVPGQTRSEAAEIRELRKRNRLLEQENEVLRRFYGAAALSGTPPVRAVQVELDITHRSASDWIRKARDAGRLEGMTYNVGRQAVG